MADNNFGGGLANILVGADKITAQNKLNQMIADLTAKLDVAINDEERQRLIDKIQNLKSISEYYGEQGLLDESGQLLSAQDVQDEYVDEDYLSLLSQQEGDRKAGALARGQKAVQQERLQGGAPGSAEVLGKLEALNRQSADEMAGKYKGERELAYGKAAQQLGRQESYARALSADERSRAEAALNASLSELQTTMGLSQTQIGLLQTQIANMPDGLVQQLVNAGGEILGLWAASQIPVGGV